MAVVIWIMLAPWAGGIVEYFVLFSAGSGSCAHSIGGHSLSDQLGVDVDKVDYAVVVLGVLVVLALYHFEGTQINLYGFNYLSANPR